jgi:hypothetical protein
MSSQRGEYIVFSAETDINMVKHYKDINKGNNNKISSIVKRLSIRVMGMYIVRNQKLDLNSGFTAFVK